MDARLRMLMRWYRKNGRHTLPWRKTNDPYRIFVSEMMLQQTQVDRVIPFYRAWLKRFPSWRALARATTDELVRAWAGLGYNRRALFMRRAAEIVTTNGVPKTADEWQTLPGIGPYAAPAVAGFSMRTFLPTIDTNIRRVIGRIFFGIAHPAPDHDRRVMTALKRIEGEATYETNYALMDFGALLCTAKKPACLTCPLRTHCAAAPRFLSGRARSPNRVNRERVHAGKRFPDRIYRGRILALIRHEERVKICDIGPRVDPTYAAEHDDTWVRAMIDRLVREGFLERDHEAVSLARS